MDELEKLSREELIYNILDLNKKQLKIVADMAKYYYMMEYIDLYKLYEDKLLIKGLDNSSEKNHLLDIFNNLLNIFLDIIDNKSFDKEKVLSIREEIYDYSEVLSAYYIELKFVREKIDLIVLKNREKTLEVGPALEKRRDKLVEDIEKELISLIDNPMEYINLMSTIINVVPFKLSKYKYYNLVEDSLKNNLKDYTKEHAIFQVQEYKKQFDPKLNKNYGLYFDEYFTDIELFKRKDFDNMSTNNLKEMTRRVNLILDEIGYNMMNIRRIGILTNRILTMGIISEEYDIDFDREVLGKFLEKDKNIEELVRKSFKEKEKELFEIVGDFKDYNDELFEREEDNRELDEEFEKAKDLLIYYNDIEFSSNDILNIKDGAKEIDRDYLDKLIDNFIDFIKRNIKDFEVREGRIRMRELLTVFVPPFKNLKEFMDYLNYSLDERIISREELNIMLISLNYLLENR